MSDPKRLLDQETGEIRDLLRAARDVPGASPAAQDRMLGVLGVGPALVPSAGAGASGAPATGLATGGKTGFLSAGPGHWLLGGILLGSAAIASWEIARGNWVSSGPPQSLPAVGRPSPAAPRNLPNQTGRLGRTSPGAPLVSSAVSDPAEGKPPPATTVDSVPVWTNGARALSRARRPEPDGSSALELDAELEQLKLARSALVVGQLSEAGAALGAYRRRFPQGQLLPESELLRLELLTRQGHREAARSLAESLQHSAPSQRYREQIQNLFPPRDPAAETLSEPKIR